MEPDFHQHLAASTVSTTRILLEQMIVTPRSECWRKTCLGRRSSSGRQILMSSPSAVLPRVYRVGAEPLRLLERSTGGANEISFHSFGSRGVGCLFYFQWTAPGAGRWSNHYRHGHGCHRRGHCERPSLG